jgi:1-deoxy-D-xylulose-5-phosphate reductoisomerase
VLNAANEIAVAAFLAGTLPFTSIHTLNARTLERLQPQLQPDHGLDDLLDLDRRARDCALQLLKEIAP